MITASFPGSGDSQAPGPGFLVFALVPALVMLVIFRQISRFCGHFLHFCILRPNLQEFTSDRGCWGALQLSHLMRGIRRFSAAEKW
jgi:hypothetical protein